MKTLKLQLAALAALVMATGTAVAQDIIQVTTEVFQEVEVTGANGKKEKKTQPATKIVPGTEVIYVITYRNAGDKAAEKVVVNNAVPKELTYKGGSASGRGARFEVSVDGGSKFGALPSLRVTGADGKPRPAQAADVTHLRWSVAKPVAPGASGSVSYRAVLR